MTRRDVAAMTWALCQLRTGDLGEAIATLRAADDEAQAIGDAAYSAGRSQRGLGYLVTARLALYLRARLRAEAGDYGPKNDEWCPMCDGPCRKRNRRITPLWEQAAMHGGGR